MGLRFYARRKDETGGGGQVLALYAEISWLLLGLAGKVLGW